MTDALRDALQAEANKAYCDYIEQLKHPECQGEDAKFAHGSFGKAELNAHVRAGALLGRHRAFTNAVALLAASAPDKREALRGLLNLSNQWRHLAGTKEETDGEWYEQGRETMRQCADQLETAVNWALAASAPDKREPQQSCGNSTSGRGDNLEGVVITAPSSTSLTNAHNSPVEFLVAREPPSLAERELREIAIRARDKMLYEQKRDPNCVWAEFEALIWAALAGREKE